MKNIIVTTLLSFYSLFLFSQEEVKRYFKDEFGKNETTEKSAKYTETTRKLNDSITFKEYRNIKTGHPLWEINLYKGHPYGKCRYYKANGTLNREVNYDFVLTYGVFVPDGFLKVNYKTETPEGNVSGSFSMPVVKTSSDKILSYLYGIISFPEFAVENGISGIVYAQLTVDKNGKVGNISIVRGVHESLDWEVCRIIRELPELTPAKLNDQNTDVHMILPVKFILQ